MFRFAKSFIVCPFFPQSMFTNKAYMFVPISSRLSLQIFLLIFNLEYVGSFALESIISESTMTDNLVSTS